MQVKREQDVPQHSQEAPFSGLDPGVHPTKGEDRFDLPYRINKCEEPDAVPMGLRGDILVNPRRTRVLYEDSCIAIRTIGPLSVVCTLLFSMPRSCICLLSCLQRVAWGSAPLQRDPRRGLGGS